MAMVWSGQIMRLVFVSLKKREFVVTCGAARFLGSIMVLRRFHPTFISSRLVNLIQRDLAGLKPAVSPNLRKFSFK